jgi:exodeoxyribonuclease V alpha subunit
MNDSDQEVKVDKASELNTMLLGYCLTVHKSQGSEWRKVFLVLHQSHATMLQRELLYTAVTRAREELYIICEPECFVKGIESQRVKGNTLEEKAEFFKGKIDAGFVLES